MRISNLATLYNSTKFIASKRLFRLARKVIIYQSRSILEPYTITLRWLNILVKTIRYLVNSRLYYIHVLKLEISPFSSRINN